MTYSVIVSRTAVMIRPICSFQHYVSSEIKQYVLKGQNLSPTVIRSARKAFSWFHLFVSPGAEKYYQLFGSNPPGGQFCVKFVAQIIKEPVLGDLYGNRKVHLLYVVSYIEVIPPSVHVQSRRRIEQLKAAQI